MHKNIKNINLEEIDTTFVEDTYRIQKKKTKKKTPHPQQNLYTERNKWLNLEISALLM